jgi:hypothetical protein
VWWVGGEDGAEFGALGVGQGWGLGYEPVDVCGDAVEVGARCRDRAVRRGSTVGVLLAIFAVSGGQGGCGPFVECLPVSMSLFLLLRSGVGGVYRGVYPGSTGVYLFRRGRHW